MHPGHGAAPAPRGAAMAGTTGKNTDMAENDERPRVTLDMLRNMVVRIPTDVELRPVFAATAASVLPFALQNLPPAVLAMSMASVFVPLTPEVSAILAKAVGASWDADEEGMRAGMAASGLIPALDSAVAAVGGRAFAKLGTRSAKDGWHTDRDARPLPVGSGTELLESFMGCSERIYEDLRVASVTGADTAIAVRPYVDFRPGQEYRLFVTDGSVAGISQMYCDRKHEDPERARSSDLAAIEGLAAALVPAMAMHTARTHDSGSRIEILYDGPPCTSFTADVAVFGSACLLVEINPDVRCGTVNPLLFLDGGWDGGLRIVDTDPPVPERAHVDDEPGTEVSR